MKVYLTSESRQKIKNSFSNLSLFQIIDVQEILKSLDMDLSIPSSSFLVNEEIIHAIEFAIKSKKTAGIIYINSSINENIIKNLKEVTDSLGDIDSYVMIDDQDNPKMMKYYKYVDEVLYFPVFKKIKIIECQPLPITIS